MWQYRYEQEHEEKPFWCVIIEYEPDEPEYYKYPKARKYLTGKGFENLTMAQAEQKANELDQRLHPE